MSFFHGVTTTIVNDGPRTISLPSSSIIGLVDTFTASTGPLVEGVPTAVAGVPYMITTEREAIAAFGADSAITRACKAIYVRAKAVIVAVGVEKIDDAAALTSAVIGGVKANGDRTGLQALLDGKSRFNAQPRLLIAPLHSSTQAVATAMDALAEKLGAIGIIDGPGTTDEAAMEYALNFGSKRLYMVDPGVISWSTTANADVASGGSAWAAGMFAYTDATYGFWVSPSNKEMVGITGTTRQVEYLENDPTCRANLLNNAFITTIIRDGGYRLWGNRTLSSDAKWSFVTRVRTLDIIMSAVQAGHKWAVDLGITKTYVKDVTEGLQAFMRDLKAQGAIINFEVYPDLEMTTASMLSQGRIFWRIRFTDVPVAENPTFLFEVTDQWVTQVLDIKS
ncbi:phage tail sheath subtilisin-like domain-containing protein (plasmid) [Pseudomonas sp. B26140]|uniref:phage tail sheath subtilisin-like domain-containing protein n=1 Tax=Pseudomonas sp. B26140 TaxID=3235112 RepID=UPI0037835675